jgi:hypothetical protein
MAIAPDSSSLNVKLRNARPSNQAHLLLWDTPTEAALNQIAFYNNAQRVNYRQDLISRIDPGDRFLNLHLYSDRELDAIKTLCRNAQKPMVILEGLDCLLSYLRISPDGRITLFWNALKETRKLDALLWILLPTAFLPPTWPSDRTHTISI